MALSFDSPRYSLRTADFSDITDSIERTGHVVLEDVWNVPFLDRILRVAQEAFEEDDRNVNRLPPERVGSYIGGVTPCSVMSDPAFSPEFERSGITALLRLLFAGSFVVDGAEQATRRVDPKIAARFTGLHRDFQLDELAIRGLRTDRAVTIWTPLLDCSDEMTPRLLLFAHGEAPEAPRPTMLGELHKQSEQHSVSPSEMDAMFEGIYQRFECYAPHVPLGGAIVFDRNVVHGTYRHSSMTKVRYSFDVRALGEYALIKNRVTPGRIYRQDEYGAPPSPKPAPWNDPRIRAALKPYLQPLRALILGR
jgi:hypothetical protein